MKKYCFGVDVGGTTVKVGLFTVEGQLLDKWEIITRTENNGENILFDICESLEAKLDEKSIDLDEVKGIGIGLPGPVLDDGTVLQCVNLGWGKFNVSEKMSEMFHGIEVKAGNDANVAALGEAWKGGGKDFDDIVMVTLGTGVGGGVILEGKILTGHNGAAGEIGHMHVEDGEELNCNCGGCGCLEQYASATGVVRLANRYIAKNSESTKMTEFGEDITAKDVFDLAKEGDKGAVAVVEQMSTYLGKAMASIATVVNPQAFIIGGGGLPADAPVLYGHRSAGDADIYFISNQKDEMIEIRPEFRIRSRQPELWDATTGRIRTLPAYEETAAGTVVPLKLYPYESAFVVFRRPATKAEGTGLQLNYPVLQTLVRLDAPWKVSFEEKRRGPASQTFARLEDISKNENPDIRYYSGTIWYETEFKLKKKPEGELYLNLNDVGVMAKVKINGQYAGGVWTAPYRVNVTDLVRKGKNKVEIEVVTTWMNRLIGDSGLPESERKTWTPCNSWKPTDMLQKSGLVGPVCIECVN